MDHDDDDFQGQNHQLAGEGNSKFSPVLRPYALPKFDFDDSLQGHLRFDTLVENEVFLGIPSQEDNQWIEDYSRGNSGLEFSSSAAESCSISRRNNVWSEATSSESVEMLLKSVAHGEMMLPGETIIEEPEGCDELDGSLTNQTDNPNLSQHDKTEDVEQKEVDNFDSIVISEENVAITGKPDSSDSMVEDDSVNRSLNENIQDDQLLTDNTYIPLEDTHHDLPIDGKGKEGVDEQHIKSLEVNDNDKVSTSGTAEETCDFINRVESVKSHTSGEITVVEYKETSSLQVTGDSDVQIGESSKDLFSTVDPASVFTKETSTTVQFGGTANEESQVVFEKNNVEIGNGSVSGNEDFHESDTQLDDKGDEKATAEASLVNRIEEGGDSNPVVQNDSTPVLFEENNVEVGSGSVSGNENFHESDTQLDDKGAEKATEEATLVNSVDSNPVVQNDSNAVEVFPPLVDGSMQSCEEQNFSVQEGDFHKGGEVFPLPENDNSLDYEALPVGENMEGHTGEAHGEVDASNENNPVNTVTTETVLEVTDHNEELKSTTVGTGLAYDDKQGVEAGVGTSASLSKLNESSDSVSSVEKGKSDDFAIRNVNEEVVERPVLIVETSCIPSNVNEPVANIIGEEGSEKTEVAHTYDSKNILMSDKAELVDFGNMEKVMVEGYNEDASVEVPDASPIPDQSDDKNKPIQSAVEVSPDANHEANQIVDSDSQTIGVKTGPVDLVPSSEGGGIPTDFDKTNCGSPTIISGIQVSHSERDRNEGSICPAFHNDPLFSAATDPKYPSISKETDSSKEEKSFTFEVSPSVVLSEGETGKVWKSFPSIQASKITTIEGVSPSTSSINQTNITIPREIPQSTPQTIEVETPQRGSKATPERKPRRSSAKSAGKESGRKGSHMKEKINAIELERIGDNKSLGSMNPLVAVPVVQSEELKPYGNVERNGGKASGVSSVPASNLPDLNTSVSPASLFQQPFTDVQQVQLRAQIFVYGSLIQGVAPDETCMASAFGPSDGGRSAWDTKWRAYVERIQVQKSTANNTESPAQARTSEPRNAGTSIRTTDHASKHVSSTPSHENKVLSTPVGRSSTKSTPSGTTVGVVTPQQSVNPIIPLSSPLWNIPTPSSERNPLLDYHQALSPLNPYQQQPPPPQPVRNFVAGPTPSWLSQASFPGPWIASPQASSYDVNACFSRFPATESVKLTPVKESSAPFSTSVKHASPIPLPHIIGPNSAVTLSSSEQQPKSRKRKKVLVTEDLSPIPLPPHVHVENKKIESTSDDLPHHSISLLASAKPERVSAPAVNAHFSASPAVTNNNSGKLIPVLSPPSTTDMHAKQGDYSREKKSLDPSEVGNIVDVEVAKVQAEEAASHAAVAISNCEDVWSRLVKQKNSGLVSSDIEATLASAAVASAAAASVAKAAAAAAKVASNAAFRAKLMVEEALATQNAFVSSLPNTSNISQATISKGGDGSKSSSSIISAAKEAARKRIEAATAASKHAENLEAIVKAAELAAEAVSQAGKIVAMGDPLTLNELLAFSPEGYKNLFKTDSFEKDGPVSAKQLDERRSDIEKVTVNQNEPAQKEISGDLHLEGRFSVVDVISGTGTSDKTNFKGKTGHPVSESGKTIEVVPEAEFGSISTSDIGPDEFEKEDGSSSEKIIKQGCLVEVHRDLANGKSGWFSARVLRLKDEKAFVGYTELKHDKEPLEEWVPLGEKGNKAPKIRIAHPMSTMHHSEGTRKRRRAALSDYTWSIGDKVDAWIEDCWCEGFVAKKNTKDETTVTVSFPGHGEKSVKAWDLRPTLVYKDREWIQWSNSRVLERTSQGDTPKEKRAKIEDKGMEKAWKFNEDEQPEKHGESRLLLPLSMSENTFSMGKSTGVSSKIDSVGGPMRTTGFQGSGVNIGVPKPGKKRKFMAVSEHYISESSSNKSKTPVPNHSVKFTKYLIPQGSRGSKIEAKEKQGRELKSKAPRSSGRTIFPQKVTTDSAGKNSNNNNNSMNEESESSQQKSMEFKSNPEVVSRGLVFSSKPLVPDTVATTKRLPPLAKAKASERKMNKGKFVSGKSTRVVEVKERSVPDTVVEPQRRSNRKIQPTSRLLEGLQSQLIISKIPSASHDKSHRSQNRGTSKGN